MNSKKEVGALRRQKKQQDSVALGDLPVPTVICDEELRVIGASKSFEEVSGISHELIRKSPYVYNLLPFEERNLAKVRLNAFVKSGKISDTLETKWSDKEKHEHILLWTLQRVVRNGVVRIIGQANDVTQSKTAQDRILKDSLTGLYKNKIFESTLERLLAQGVRDQLSFAVINIDLAHFKRFNHAHGTEIAERLLIEVAQRLKRSVHGSDLVVRFGADKFGVILTELSHPHDALRVAEKILQDIRIPIWIDDIECAITCSIGLVIPTRTETLDMIKAHADQAMHRAKESGRDCVVMYDEAMNQDARAEIALENQLRHAVNEPDKWFVLHYMPIVSLETGLITKFEALIRMRDHVDLGKLIMPNDFIFIAEKTGLILPIGEWVLKRASETLAEWHKIPKWREISMSVNVSVKQIERDEFISTLNKVIEQTGINPASLRLEVTETVVISRQQRVHDVFEELRKMNIRSSIDDFGSGQTTLQMIAQLPMSSIKLDMSMITGVDTNPRKETVLRHLIAMGIELEKLMISEGVETFNQAKAMMLMKCEMAQGFWFNCAVDKLTAERMIDDQPFVEQVMFLRQTA